MVLRRSRMMETLVTVGLAGASVAVALLGLGSSPAAAASGPCVLNGPNGPVSHVVYLQFDNTHLTRDNPRVPSDLEQMPALRNFMKTSGTLYSKHYTPLISHTADDIITSLTGLYPDRHGAPIANSYGYYNAGDPAHTLSFTSAFKYWTDPVATNGTDPKPNLIGSDGKNTPAPWVPYTRAGCNVGGVGTANIELENSRDVAQFYGAGSPETRDPNPDTNFVGLSVHCAQGAALCSSANRGHADLLPDEPGGYQNYNALMGARYLDPAITPQRSPAVNSLGGAPITDQKGNPGFPGFDGMTATNSLGYVAQMQEAGVPVTYAYLSAPHNNNDPKNPRGAFGPGEKGYHDQLVAYNRAFAMFFARLAKDGINKTNTLFVVTADENDHFVGSAPDQGKRCNGVTRFCTYRKIGEIDVKMDGSQGILQGEKHNPTPFGQTSDSAPSFYLTGHPTQPQVRQFERDAGTATVTNPITGRKDLLRHTLADPAELALLHMVTTDPQKTPTLTMFGDPNFWMNSYACDASAHPTQPGCVHPEGPTGDAWNHGTDATQVVRTWLGLVGPGVKAANVDDSTWSDHTDIRPTMMSLVGLKDSYYQDGRVITEALSGGGPDPQEAQKLRELGTVYKQLDAPVAQFGHDTLQFSTAALLSGNASNDGAYANAEKQLSSLGGDRDKVATEISDVLGDVEFKGYELDQSRADSLIKQAQSLLARAHALAGQGR